MSGRRFAAALVAVVLCALAAPAARAARIEGVVLRTSGGPLGGPLPVLLFTFDRSGWRQTTETTTDDAGRFAFADLQTPSYYWVSVRADGVMYPGRMVEIGQEEQQQTKSVSIALYERTEESPPIEISGMEVTIEPEDAGVFRVTKEVFLENPKANVLSRKPESGEPLVRIGLAPGHQEVQTRLFPFLPLDSAEKDGELQIYGPLFPAQQIAEVSYQVLGSSRGLQTELVLPQAVKQLTLLLPPAQFAFDVPELHPGPVDRDSQSGQMRHQSFLGFDLPAGTRIPLRLIARTPPPPQSSGATAGLILVLFAAGALLVLQPVLGASKASAPLPAEGPAGENEALYIALRDLEEDFELGKVSREDRDRMREELKNEALRNLSRTRRAAAERDEQTKTAAARAQRTGAAYCSQCGHRTEASDRFCSSCGHRLKS